MPSKFDESLVDSRYYPNHGDYAVEVAYKKVLDISECVGDNHYHPYIIIGADTVVSMNGKIYGKPDTTQTAVKYLQEYVLCSTHQLADCFEIITYLYILFDR